MVSNLELNGSPYDDMIRWDYSSMNAGGGSGGCFICYTGKNDSWYKGKKEPGA